MTASLAVRTRDRLEAMLTRGSGNVYVLSTRREKRDGVYVLSEEKMRVLCARLAETGLRRVRLRRMHSAYHARKR